ncbi:methyl-accepting chemotaxis protein [Pantoea septica]|uniref:methyl-accepting chemotaxis protein n=1 Tax=Pantoea septica TaxID=472695 RepID=UPI002896B17F|nr:methyl-accepting chemotaxis protein [Pantoea septica]
MFRNLRLTTGVIAVLTIFTLLLALTGALFYASALKADKNFITAQQLTQQQQYLGDTVQTLIKTRVTITRVAIRFLKNQKDPASLAAIATLLNKAEGTADDAQKLFNSWQAIPPSVGQSPQEAEKVVSAWHEMHSTMKASIGFLKQGNYQAYGNLDAQRVQDQLDLAYESWRARNNDMMKQTFQQNQQSLTDALRTLLVIALSACAIILAVWAGLKALLLGPVNRLTGYMRAISAGDLASDIKSEGRNELGLLVTEMQLMRDALITTLSSVNEATRAIFTGASEISSGSTDLSSRTEQQAAALEETAASMEQITSTVKLNAENAQQASAAAKEASGMATHGGETVDRVIANMQEISDSSAKIAGIIGIIDGIAFQTNILALNAAVEAARAGEQGRGFAVVAGEVRSLAGRSASAAQEIKMLIEQSVQRIQSGAGHASEAGKSMSGIVNSVNRVTLLMEEIASSSAEQTRGIEQVSKAVSEMDGVTHQNASLVQQSASAAASLEEQAMHLRQAVATFKIGSLAAQSVPQPAV